MAWYIITIKKNIYYVPYSCDAKAEFSADPSETILICWFGDQHFILL